MLEIVEETLRAGAEIAKGYRLERIVGEGGMGVVWEAIETASGRRVALKFLREKRQADSRNQARVLREARATMAIVHPNIAKVYAVLETDAGVPFLVMELLEGKTLRSFLLRPTPLSPVECARILLPVVSAVQAAHDQRIVHRDLKPENIFLLRHPENEVRVLDFGIAKQLARVDATTVPVADPSLTSTGALIGTPVYMAPEQIFGDDDIDGRADIWSLGIILYECLTGRRPTDGEGFGQIIKRITTDTIEPIDRVLPALPHRLTKLVTAMLTRDRAARPTLAEVQSVLASLETRDVDAPPSRQPIQPNIRRIKRGPLVLIGSASAVVALVVGGLALTKKKTTSTQVAPPTETQPTTTPSPTPSAQPIAPAGEDPSKMILAAQRDVKNRDGAACRRELDHYDASPSRGAFAASTDPKGSLSLRSTCVMLTGDCDTGKALYRTSIIKSDAMMGFDVLDVDIVASFVDQTAAQYCEGDKLTPREKFLRAVSRMDAIAMGSRSGTSATCKESYEVAERLLPAIVSARVGNDPIIYTPDTIYGRATTCFAHVGDCSAALQAYRREFPGTLATAEAQADRDKDMFRGYDITIAGTACVGKH
jgi:eukaryotic-like serine/threonine-protein kinase